MVRGDDHAAGVRHGAAHLGEPTVGGRQHRGHPVAVRVQRRTPGGGGLLDGERLPQRRGDLLAGPGAPRRRTAVGKEQHRSYDTVAERVAVAVGVVAGRPGDPVGAALVPHEGDGVGVAAKRRAGQREPPGRRLEGLLHGVAPGQGVPGVVHLVQDHERTAAGGPRAVQRGVRGDAGVGQRDTVEVRAGGAHGVAEPGVEHDPDLGGSQRPLGLQVLGRSDDGDGLHHARRQQLRGDAQREGRLARTGSGDRQVVARCAAQVVHQRGALPGTQRNGGGVGHKPFLVIRRHAGRGVKRAGRLRGAARLRRTPDALS